MPSIVIGQRRRRRHGVDDDVVTRGRVEKCLALVLRTQAECMRPGPPLGVVVVVVVVVQFVVVVVAVNYDNPAAVVC